MSIKVKQLHWSRATQYQHHYNRLPKSKNRANLTAAPQSVSRNGKSQVSPKETLERRIMISYTQWKAQPFL